MSTTTTPATDRQCTARICLMHLMQAAVFVMLLTASSAWSIRTLLYQTAGWSELAAMVIAICATLCVVWLFAGKIRRALLLWMVCATAFLAWYQFVPQTVLIQPWAEETVLQTPVV